MMNLRGFVHKIRIGFQRMRGNAIPSVPEEKRHGNDGEDAFAAALRQCLPECRIKRNVLISVEDGNAELDCLILYGEKLFAIEVKNWIGDLAEDGGRIVQRKQDKWTGETHTKYHKSPFQQLKRAVYLLRKQISVQAWVTPIVYFNNADSVSITADVPYFVKIEALAEYIARQGETNRAAAAFFDEGKEADRVQGKTAGRVLLCRISDASLSITTNRGLLHRADIHRITVKHHWSYDEIYIQTKAATEVRVCAENAWITVFNGIALEKYAMSKIDCIELRS